MDFYCCKVRLAVENDGGHHNTDENRIRDRERTDELAATGISVLRFWNSEIFKNTEGVLQKIYDTARLRLDTPPS